MQMNKTNIRPGLSLPSLCAVTPIGPFCPFRSDAAVEMDPTMETMSSSPDFAIEMTRIQLDMQIGKIPDPTRLQKVASGIDDAVSNWEQILKKMNQSPDFQTREYAKLTEAHLAKYGQSSEEIITMMRWQAKCMMSMAQNRPPPLPPPGLNIMKMMETASKEHSKPPPSLSSMTAAGKITVAPFDEDKTFQSETVRKEYELLCQDHSKLIKFGAQYANFDALGKIAFLDEIDKIHDRWDVFFARFSLMGQLNREFIRQCDRFLESMNMTEADFKELMKETHQMMRKAAERERGRVIE
jgi:hypothetical protein